jgi:hypothetical protein
MWLLNAAEHTLPINRYLLPIRFALGGGVSGSWFPARSLAESLPYRPAVSGRQSVD